MHREPDPRPPGAVSVDDLAAEFVARVDQGETPGDDEYLNRLSGDEARRSFRSLVRAVRSAERTFPSLAPGRVLAGRYRLLRPLRGGAGRTFAALDRAIGREVALKALWPHEVDRRRLVLVRRRARRQALLHHPNLVAWRSLVRDGDVVAATMDLVPGRSWTDVVRRARAGGTRPGDRSGLVTAIGLPTPPGRPQLIGRGSWWLDAAAITRELARAVEALHASGLVHGALEPDKVLLLGGGSPVVLDAGRTGRADEPTADARSLYGSFGYLAPEQAAGLRAGCDPRTDVYRVGLLLYELLTLERAFPKPGRGTVLEAIRRGALSRPRRLVAGVPADLESICLSALARDPARRPPSMAALRTALDAWLASRAAPARPRAPRPTGLFALLAALSRSLRDPATHAPGER